MSTVLRPCLFMNAEISASTYGLFNADPDYDQDRLRSISGIRADINDSIYVLLETVVPIFGQNGTLTSTVIVTATATVFTNANGAYNSCVLQGAFTRIKLQKVGASGAATFVGYI